METIQLNEANKFNWQIKYIALTDDGKDLLTLASGKVFDFIPNVDDLIRINNKNYTVIRRRFDFDNEIIWINLSNYVL